MASVIINAILMFVEKYFYGLAVVVAARYRPFGRVLCGRGGKTLHPTVDSSVPDAARNDARLAIRQKSQGIE